MRPLAHAGEFGVGDVVLGDDVGDQRAHAEEPGADADQHQRRRRQDGVVQDRKDEFRASSPGRTFMAKPPLIGRTGHTKPKMITSRKATM